MNSFQLDVPFDGQENWTKAYRLSNGKPVEIEDEAHYWKHGAGAYKSDVTDFAKFAVALMKSKLIKRKTSIQMMTVQTTKDGKETDFGLGVRVSGTGKSLKVYHGGAQDETRTRMVIFPNRRHGVVVMCNCRHANPTDISTAIYKALKAKNVKY